MNKYQLWTHTDWYTQGWYLYRDQVAIQQWHNSLVEELVTTSVRVVCGAILYIFECHSLYRIIFKWKLVSVNWYGCCYDTNSLNKITFFQAHTNMHVEYIAQGCCSVCWRSTQHSWRKKCTLQLDVQKWNLVCVHTSAFNASPVWKIPLHRCSKIVASTREPPWSCFCWYDVGHLQPSSVSMSFSSTSCFKIFGHEWMNLASAFVLSFGF